MRNVRAMLILAGVLAGCSVIGPPAIHLSRGDIAERAFVDRERTDLRRLLGRFEGLAISGPDVGMQIEAQRLQLEWTMSARQTPAGMPMTLSIAISGRPELNESRSGIDLTDTRIEQIRLPALPLFDLGTRNVAQGEALGRMPLLAFRPDELNRDGIVYQPTGLSLGPFGLRVDLAPK
jgi:hypothetical protein